MVHSRHRLKLIVQELLFPDSAYDSFLVTDYLGMRSRLPFGKSKNNLLKFISAAVVWFIAAIAIIVLMVAVMFVLAA